MSTNLQEIIDNPQNLVAGIPDLRGHGVETAYSVAAWLTLRGAAFDKIELLAKSIDSKLSIQKTDPQFRRAVRLLTPVFIQSEAVPVAISALVSIADDSNASPSARVSAANSILDHAKSSDMRGPGDGKSPEEMTIEELQAAIDDLEHEAANRARDITPQKELDETELARDDSYMIDLL